MIGLVFTFGNDTIEVRVQDINVHFRTSELQQFATIDGLKLDKTGVIKEFPDLKDNEDWKAEAIKRFKDKIKKMATEMERANYVIEDLKKFGYKPMFMQRQGFRPTKL